MPTHEDKRLVATKLRSFVTGNSENAMVEAYRVLYALGLLYADNDRTYFRECDVVELANLIEPDPYAEEIAANECIKAANYIDWNLGHDDVVHGLKIAADDLRRKARAREVILGNEHMRHTTDEEKAAYSSWLEANSTELLAVDRNALLALADTVAKARNALPCTAIDWEDTVTISRSMLDDIANRIRKACGIEQ